MTKPMIKIHDVTTGEIIEREMNEVELANFEASAFDSQQEIELKSTKAAEKSALLEKLGITADEAALLLS